MSPSPNPPTDPGFVQDLIIALGKVLEEIADSNPVTEALLDILPPLVRFVVSKINKGADPRDTLYPLILAEADKAADLAEDIKFGPERPTKP